MNGDGPSRASARSDARLERQRALDADQAASDADQAGSERDESAAVIDQEAADSDQAIADRQRRADDDEATAASYVSARIARETSTLHRLVAHASRARTAQTRAQTAAARDVIAAKRDAAAARRDVRAQKFEGMIANSDGPLAEKLEQLRAHAAADRAHAAVDRVRAARDRAHSARERGRLESALSGAQLDDLTGAFRRETGRLALAHEIDRARRADGRFVLAFVDVDDLKAVNDRDGHAAGDRLLRALVSTMRSGLRSFDPIVRYGGDEFICGLGGADVGDVKNRFETIGREIHADVGASISVGLAALGAGETLEQVTARADAALLEIKALRESSRPSPVGRPDGAWN